MLKRAPLAVLKLVVTNFVFCQLILLSPRCSSSSSSSTSSFPSKNMAPVAASAIKTIYLIRHAESEENRRIASLGRIFSGLGKFTLPSKSDLKASVELLNVTAQVDSNVSAVGTRQISTMALQLKQHDFLRTAGIALVAHSPLLRARQTCEGVLDCVASSSTDGTGEVTPLKIVEPVQRVVEVDLLAEKTPQEWTPLYFSTFLKRIDNFESWLAEQPEDTIAIVGHSQYFKAMLGLDFKFGNCDVWKVTFDDSQKRRNEADSSTPVAAATAAAAATVEPSATNDPNDKDTTTTLGSGWTLPPQYTNLALLYKCDVRSSKKEDEAD
jgi:broad specificity phosphatase PhoE